MLWAATTFFASNAVTILAGLPVKFHTYIFRSIFGVIWYYRYDAVSHIYILMMFNVQCSVKQNSCAIFPSTGFSLNNFL